MRLLVLLSALVAATAHLGWAAEPPMPDPAEGTYQKARTCYYDLKKSPTQQKQRGAWEGCIRLFLTVERDFPQSERAADAAYSAGKLYEELFHASKNAEDCRLAIQQYDQLARRYTKHRLADDALYRIGVVRWEGLKEPGKAKAAMWRVVRWYPDSDMAIEARKFLRTQAEGKGSTRPAGALLELKHPPVSVPSPPAADPQPIIERTLTEDNKPQTQAPNPPARPLRIVIDPGHGGKDVGAIGPGGTREKDVTLQIGKRLAGLLREQLPCEVTLTRDRDVYLTLAQRNAVGNRRRADLFISIHANAGPSKTQRGIQTYYLNNATDEAARRLADRENRAVGKSLPELQAILSTMLQTAYTDESRDLAKHVHRQVVGQLKTAYTSVNDQGVRTALFYVLVGAKSPSILVETSYLSHPEEERRLRDPRYQATIARAIVKGIAKFVDGRPAIANL